MVGLPSIITRYEDNEGRVQVKEIIVDREGMAVEFLASLHAAGRTVVTVLRTDQYRDLTSFTEVGAFVPLRVDGQGNVVREVAPARITFPLPEPPGEVLSLQVALIRDLRRMVAVQPGPEDGGPLPQWDADREPTDPRWWEERWQATAAPASTATPKLIPIVSTASTVDAVELAQTYIRRWPVQENVIKDFLLPLGLDTNHGYSKTAVENSEVARQQRKLEKRLARLNQWAHSAGKRHLQAKERHTRLQTQLKRQCQILGDKWGWYQTVPTLCSGADPLKRQEIKERNAKLDVVLKPLTHKVWEVEQQSKQELAKQEHYCKEQREVLRALEDLAAKERTMYELDVRPVQLKLALEARGKLARERTLITDNPM